jgi:hypothetical protein
MPDEELNANLLRWIAAEIYFSLGMQAAREMYGKSYFSLGAGEKVAVDNAVGATVQGNFRAMTLDFLTGQDQPSQKSPASKPPVGFQNPAPKAGS